MCSSPICPEYTQYTHTHQKATTIQNYSSKKNIKAIVAFSTNHFSFGFQLPHLFFFLWRGISLFIWFSFPSPYPISGSLLFIYRKYRLFLWCLLDIVVKGTTYYIFRVMDFMWIINHYFASSPVMRNTPLGTVKGADESV